MDISDSLNGAANVVIGYYVKLAQNSAKTNTPRTVCIAFELVSTGGAKVTQSSRMGRYERQPRLINDRVFYYNEDKEQYLYWITKEGGFWMVSIRNIRHKNESPNLHVLSQNTS